MVLVELLVRVTEALDRVRLRFVLFGGMAVSVWIQPRLTRDCDIVVMARRRDTLRLKQALLAAGAHVTALEMRWLFERRFVRLKTGGPLLDVHILASRHDRTAFDPARPVEYRGCSVAVVRPEDLVLYKLKAWRGQDQVDIASILEQTRGLDVRYVESWLDVVAEDTGFPIRERWNAIRQPPGADSAPLLKRGVVPARRRAASSR